MISFSGDRLEVLFERFDLEAYALFLKCKGLPESELVFDETRETYTLRAPARFADLLGVQRPALRLNAPPYSKCLFDYQRDITQAALEVKRWASWWDCGLGKTYHEWEFARQVAARTGGRVLILTLKEIIPQFCEMVSEAFGEAPVVLKTRAELIQFCKGEHPSKNPIAITNYEKFVVQGGEPNAGVIPELKYLAGLVADESSVLKSGGGVIKWNLIKSARGIEYKLSCTATPAPNDLMEYASQAAFLEKLRSEGDILWTYFSKNHKTNEWEIKPHALEAFYRFMASWSIYLRNPGRYGWKDNVKALPEPEFHVRAVAATADQKRMAAELQKALGGRQKADDVLTPAQEDEEISLGIVGRSKLAQIAKGFVYSTSKSGKRSARRILSAKPGEVAAITRSELSHGRQCLVWTEFDEETAILRELLNGPGIEVLTGSTSPKDRAAIIARFRRGETAALITRADLLGFGQNFQFCQSMVFSAFNDSFEEFYQAVRRSYRYGQTERVQIHVPYVPECEGAIWANLQRKAENFEADTAKQEDAYLKAYLKAMGEIGLRRAG